VEAMLPLFCVWKFKIGRGCVSRGVRKAWESEEYDWVMESGTSAVCCRRDGVISAAEEWGVDLVGTVWTRFSGLSPAVVSVLVLVDDEALGLLGFDSPENMVLDVRVDRTTTGLRVVLSGLRDGLVFSVVWLRGRDVRRYCKTRFFLLHTFGYPPTLL
jgi:hypothetical protein